MKWQAENFAVLSLELGGKSPILVFDDANVESTVNGLIAGNWGASGQSCVVGSRALVQRGVYGRIVEELVARAGRIRVGDSGYGREAGLDSIMDYTRTRTTWISTSASAMADPFVMG